MVSAQPGSGKTSLPGMQIPAFSLCAHMAFPGCVNMERPLCLFLSIRPPILMDWNPTLMISFNLNYLLKALSPSTVTLAATTSKHEFERDKNSVNNRCLSELNYLGEKQQIHSIFLLLIT